MNTVPRIALFLPHLEVAGGLGVHCRTLLNALAAYGHQMRLTVLCPRDPQKLFPNVARETSESPDTVHLSVIPIDIPSGFSLARPLDPILAEPLKRLVPDLLYCSYYTGMADPGCPQIVCFHDAGFLENPAGFGETARIRRETMELIRPAVSLIQCISNDARDRICRMLPWPREKTAVVWHALPDDEAAIAAARQSPPPDHVKPPYFLVPVGAATGFNRKRKNVPAAVEAFRMLPPGSARLVIAGTATLTDAVLTELLPPTERGSLSEGHWLSEDRQIVIWPTVDRADLLRAMRHAAAVVYPSRYEGFGLPVIEAMAVRTPLIAARATSLPEIVGDCGILIDPDDRVGFAEAMRLAIEHPDRHHDMTERGGQRVELFQPEKLATEMCDLFRSLLPQ